MKDGLPGMEGVVEEYRPPQRSYEPRTMAHERRRLDREAEGDGPLVIRTWAGTKQVGVRITLERMDAPGEAIGAVQKLVDQVEAIWERDAEAEPEEVARWRGGWPAVKARIRESRARLEGARKAAEAGEEAEARAIAWATALTWRQDAPVRGMRGERSGWTGMGGNAREVMG